MSASRIASSPSVNRSSELLRGLFCYFIPLREKNWIFFNKPVKYGDLSRAQVKKRKIPAKNRNTVIICLNGYLFNISM